MISSCRFVLLLLVFVASSSTLAFAPPRHPVLLKKSVVLDSSSSNFENDEAPTAAATAAATVGATERLLLEKKIQKDQGLCQRVGKTVKKDGLDGVRAMVWGLFSASQLIFGVMAMALVAGLALNVAGYGYYFDEGGILHVDTFTNLRLTQEMARLAAEQQASMIP